MKFTLIALATLSATGAFAQTTTDAAPNTSMYFYGLVDAGVTAYSSNGVQKTGVGSSQLASSKLGFIGSKDVGGETKVFIKLEAGLANDSGNGATSNLNNQQSGRGVTAGTATAQGGAQGLLFNRFSYVGISGRYGEIHLGREYTGAFISTVIADPFLVTGPANALNMLANLALSNPAAAQSTFASTSNMINYLTPTVAGLTGNMQVFFGENASNTNNDGDGYAASVTYAKGPLLLTYGKQSTNGTATAAVAGKTLATQGDYKQSGLSATYDLGVAKLAFTNAHEELLRATGLAVNNSNLIGVTVPYGLAKFKASYTLSRQNSGVIGDTDKSASMVGLGVEYSIFKDATAYATYARISNADGGNSYNNGIANSDLNNSSQGYAIGLVYKF